MNEYDIRSMTLEELQAVMEKIGEKPFKAKQIYQWLHEKCAADYEEMTNLSRGLAGTAGRRVFPVRSPGLWRCRLPESTGRRNICFVWQMEMWWRVF